MSGPGLLVAGRYRLRSRIGAGGMGVVWEAWDERLERPVALKLLHREPGLDEAEADLANRRVMREARITARLHHRYAVPVYDVIEHEGQAGLVMPFLPSMTLAAILRETGPLSVGEASKVGAQVGSALTAAHSAGIVHRDVKPGNILITEDGTALISDFGIAHALGDATLTTTGLIHGTPAYLAPEVARGEEATYASDVFSFGATLYAALEGAPPFGTDQNSIALLHRVAAGHIEPPRRCGALTPLIIRMLAAEPDDRPAMTAVVPALEATRDGSRGPRPGGPAGGSAAPALGAIGATSPGPAPGAPGASPPATAPAQTRSRQTTPVPAHEVSTAERAHAPVPAVNRSAPPAPKATSRQAEATSRESEATSRADESTSRQAEQQDRGGVVAAPPAPPTTDVADGPRRRSTRLALLVGAAVLAVGAIVFLVLQQYGPRGATPGPDTSTSSAARASPSAEASTPATSARPSPTRTASPSPTRSASATPSPRRSTTKPSPTRTAISSTPTAAQLARAITSYYALMPGGTDQGWPRMTAYYQTYHAGGRSSYEAFWNAIGRVTASNVSGRSPDHAEATITYYFRDGRVVRERTSYRLVKEGGILKIAASTVISSVTL